MEYFEKSTLIKKNNNTILNGCILKARENS